MDRKCLELSKTLKDPTITEAACIAFQGFNPPKCKECEWGNGANQPIRVSQDETGSVITLKTGQSTSEMPKTILGHSGKPKAKILGRCEKTGDELTWSGCLQRKNKSNLQTCKGCDQAAFKFFERPIGSGWANSAARAGEIACPELEQRKIKKATCIMRQGKKRKAGKSCNCEHWKGEKMEKPSAMRSLVTMGCPTCQAEKAGWTNQKNYCGECEAELQERQPAVEPARFSCPTPYCANKVLAVGMLCGDCQIEALKKVIAQENPCPPDNSYERRILRTEPVKPNHIKLVGIFETLQKQLEAHKQAIKEIKHWTELLKNLEGEIVAELQQAVKDVNDAESL